MTHILSHLSYGSLHLFSTKKRIFEPVERRAQLTVVEQHTTIVDKAQRNALFPPGRGTVSILCSNVSIVKIVNMYLVGTIKELIIL
jgi:hypothetical protein